MAAHAAETPDKLSLVDYTHALTYRDLWQHIIACAEALKEAGAVKGSYVALECNQGVEFIIAMLAIQLIGATPVPVEKNASSSRRIDIAQKVKPALFVGPKESPEFEIARFLELGEISLRGDGSATWDGGFPSLDDDSEILFSTGTTGIPKGVVLTHLNDVAMSQNIIDGLLMKPDTVEILPIPLNHSFGLRRTNANLMNGSTVLIADGVLALKRVFELMDTYHANAMSLVPNMVKIIFKLSNDRLADYADVLDYVQLSSAPLPEQDKARLVELLPRTRLYNFYGSTEAGATCVYDFNEMADKVHCIGRPTGNARFIVVDENRNPIESSADNLGILASGGDVVMRGYFEEPELTRQTIENGFVFTKDLGYIEDGFVYILGRVDDVINFGGIKVAPEEIETAVETNPIVRDCAVVALKDEISGQIPVLCISLEEGAEYDMKEFRRFLTEVLGINERPQRVIVLDEIPRAYNGKLKRKELIAQLTAEN